MQKCNWYPCLNIMYLTRQSVCIIFMLCTGLMGHTRCAITAFCIVFVRVFCLCFVYKFYPSWNQYTDSLASMPVEWIFYSVEHWSALCVVILTVICTWDSHASQRWHWAGYIKAEICGGRSSLTELWGNPWLQCRGNHDVIWLKNPCFGRDL